MMKKYVEEFIANRCEEELLKNEEYINLQKNISDAYKNRDLISYSELSLKIQIITEITCYKIARKDLLRELSGTY